MRFRYARINHAHFDVTASCNPRKRSTVRFFKMVELHFWVKVLPSLLVAMCLHAHTTRALKETYRKGHDGSTVDRMLARIGEGTAHFRGDCAEGCEVRA